MDEIASYWTLLLIWMTFPCPHRCLLIQKTDYVIIWVIFWHCPFIGSELLSKRKIPKLFRAYSKHLVSKGDYFHESTVYLAVKVLVCLVLKHFITLSSHFIPISHFPLKKIGKCIIKFLSYSGSSSKNRKQFITKKRKGERLRNRYLRIDWASWCTMKEIRLFPKNIH